MAISKNQITIYKVPSSTVQTQPHPLSSKLFKKRFIHQRGLPVELGQNSSLVFTRITTGSPGLSLTESPEEITPVLNRRVACGIIYENEELVGTYITLRQNICLVLWGTNACHNARLKCYTTCA